MNTLKNSNESNLRISWCTIFTVLLVLNLPVQTRADDNQLAPESELHIARLIFQTQPWSGRGPGRPWWAIDWPDAEAHFIGGINRYTNIDVAPDSRHLRLTDDAIFDYPWLFVQQVGRWQLSELERSRLGEYLARGGFMVVDDFHGPEQWKNFLNGINGSLNQLEVKATTPVDIPADDHLMRVLYDLKQNTQIPGRRHLRFDGETVFADMPHSPASWRGIYDNSGRLIMVINYNMDMGDAWEHADDPMYPVPMTTLAYQFGINYLIYAMTH